MLEMNMLADEKLPLNDVEDDYQNHPLLALVTCDPAFRGGKPYVREAGLTVQLILTMIANGWDIPYILAQYPRATEEHIRAALLYAAAKMGPTAAA
jgi:uncharacterized protein (DUF433 family)